MSMSESSKFKLVKLETSRTLVHPTAVSILRVGTTTMLLLLKVERKVANDVCSFALNRAS